MCSRMPPEGGFTLIELLTVILLISILSFLSIHAFGLYRAKAAYASVETTLHSAVIAAEASQTDTRHLPPAVGWYFQNSAGPIGDPSAAEYLLGLKLPQKTCVWAMYNPGCADMGCLSDFVMIAHCIAEEYAEWVRWGDGWSIMVRNLPGQFPGCC